MINLSGKKKQKGFSLLQVLVSLGLLGIILSALIKFNFLQLKNLNKERVFKEVILAQGLVDQYLSIPNFCGLFFEGLITDTNQLQNGDTISTQNHPVFINMDFNQNSSILSIENVEITRPTSTVLNTIPPNQSGLMTYKINFNIEKREIDSTGTITLERKLYNEDKEIELLISRDGGANYTLEKCHLAGSKTVTMQQVLCEEVGGTFGEDYLCRFGSNNQPFMEYLCDVEKMIVAIERTNEDPICSDNTTTCTSAPIMLYPGRIADTDAQTSYCDVIQ